MLIEDFNDTIDTWINELDHYKLIELHTKPSAGSWPLGQVYIHLAKNTRYYIEQIKICASADDHMHEAASHQAIAMFSNNDFPDAMLEGPDTHVVIPQPESKDELKNALSDLRNEMNHAALLISNSLYKGKTKHPGLGYFSADNWLQFAEMHLRHHIRQKKRIDDFLKINKDCKISLCWCPHYLLLNSKLPFLSNAFPFIRSERWRGKSFLIK